MQRNEIAWSVLVDTTLSMLLITRSLVRSPTNLTYTKLASGQNVSSQYMCQEIDTPMELTITKTVKFVVSLVLDNHAYGLSSY